MTHEYQRVQFKCSICFKDSVIKKITSDSVRLASPCNIDLLKKDRQEGIAILMFILNFNYFLEYIFMRREPPNFKDANNVHLSVRNSMPMWK